MHEWIVLLHIVGAFVFILSHGVSGFMAYQISRERDRARIAALLDLSSASLGGAYLGLGLLLIGGIWAGIDGGHFGRGWIWAAIAVLVVVIVAMYSIASGFFNRLRVVVGVRSRYGPRDAPMPPAGSDAEVAGMAAGAPFAVLTGIGLGGLLIILWLMVVKPF
jgi:hypothetical protein